MNSENLVPITSTEQARELGQVGGSVSSDRKRFAARLRELKKKALTDEAAAEIVELIEDSSASALSALLFINSIKEKELSVSEQLKLGHLMIAWHKAHHGEVRHNRNANVGVTYETIQEMMMRDPPPEQEK
ncbi:MAG: hypothetical protein Q7S55_04415 [Nanoarchaeota archaeon]|nr:hypothetical protein [Nanoarchaeota archaeon]